MFIYGMHYTEINQVFDKRNHPPFWPVSCSPDGPIRTKFTSEGILVRASTLRRFGISAGFVLSTLAAAMPAAAEQQPLNARLAASADPKGTTTADGFPIPVGFQLKASHDRRCYRRGRAAGLAIQLCNVKDDLAERLVRGREQMLIDQNILSHATQTGCLTPQLAGLYGRSYAKPGTLHPAFKYYRLLNANVRANRELRAAKLAMPVLALEGGGRGGLGNFIGEQCKGYASNVKQVVLPGLNHQLPKESPTQFNAAVMQFLSPRITNIAAMASGPLLPAVDCPEYCLP